MSKNSKWSNPARQELYGYRSSATPMELWKGTGYSEPDYLKLSDKDKNIWDTYAHSAKQQAVSGLHRTESPFNNNTQYGFSSTSAEAQPLSSTASASNQSEGTGFFGGLAGALSGVGSSVGNLFSPSKYTLDDYTKAAKDKGLDFSAMSDADKLKFTSGMDASNTGIMGNLGGISTIASGLAGLYGAYKTGQALEEQNEMAKQEQAMRFSEINRQKQRDKDFASAINKSGLGSYSAGY